MKISYNWLTSYIPNLPAAEKLADVFTYHLCEVEGVEKIESGDTIFDINILPNRAHDLLCHQGVARELAGLLGLEFKDPTELYKIPATTPTKLAVDIQSSDCRRYMGRIIRGIKVGLSPAWVVQHLESVGQRSINNIVDATNIVMFDLGNPCHAFDLATVGERIVVRAAAEGESLELVGSEKIVAKLKETDLVITNGEKTLAIAGVKGGTNSGISDTTTDLVLEVANFAPVAVRKTARRIGALSDAAKRFENDLSPELAPYAMRALTALILEMCPGAVCEEIVDVYPAPQEPRTLSFEMARVNRMLGTNISADEAEKMLQRFSYTMTRDGDTITLDVPPFRLDLTGVHDMAEEIGRIAGYSDIAPLMPVIDFTPKENDDHVRMMAARAKLLADGYAETMTYAFTKKGAVEVARGPKGKEFLRTNLSDGLKSAYESNRLNAPLLSCDEIRMFEIGTVFPTKGVEETHVAYADKRGVVEATLEEFTREMALDIASIENAQKENSDTTHGAKFVMWSSYPHIVRDIAVWVPEGTEQKILEEIFTEHGDALLAVAPRLFDTFTKEKMTSLAYRLVFQAHDRTLTDEEIHPIVDKIYSALQNKGFTVR